MIKITSGHRAKRIAIVSFISLMCDFQKSGHSCSSCQLEVFLAYQLAHFPAEFEVGIDAYQDINISLIINPVLSEVLLQILLSDQL